MNWFKRIFARKPEMIVENTVHTPKEVLDEPNSMLEELFVDKTPPIALKEEEKQPTLLQSFLQTNYSTLGFGDGYDHHSMEFLTQKLNVFKTEFRYIIDEGIDCRNQEIFQLRKQMIETRGLSERLVEQVELRIAELKEIVAKLEKEKELSAFDEGLIMKSINQYKEGFLRGSKDYHEEKLFAQATGLFN
ncbi:MAG: hypothetical protein IPI10_17735 [Bacteroidetes bacterium]|nr:hypothetical protein [Bacteroidota bacterium]